MPHLSRPPAASTAPGGAKPNSPEPDDLTLGESGSVQASATERSSTNTGIDCETVSFPLSSVMNTSTRYSPTGTLDGPIEAR